MTSVYNPLPEYLYPGMQRQLTRKDETVTYGLGNIFKLPLSLKFLPSCD